MSISEWAAGTERKGKPYVDMGQGSMPDAGYFTGGPSFMTAEELIRIATEDAYEKEVARRVEERLAQERRSVTGLEKWIEHVEREMLALRTRVVQLEARLGQEGGR